MTSSISASLIAWLPSESWNDGSPEGDQFGLEGIVEVAVLADMVELVQDHRAMRLHRLGDLAEMRDDLVGRMAEIAARQHRGACTGTGSTTIIAAPPRARSS